MPQDAFTLNYLARELNNLLVGGKVNKIIAPDNDKTVLTVYNKKTYRLLLDVNPSMPRIGLIEEELPSPLTAPNFCMLLRKHLLSAEIKDISILGFDRIIKITLLSSNEFFDSKEKVLFVELMGRYSNVILTESGKVLGCNRGVNMSLDGVRPLVVGLDYVLPPTNEKLLPTDIKLVDKIFEFNGDDFALFLSQSVQGVATITAQKFVNDFEKEYGILKGKNTIEKSKQVFNELNDFLYNSKKRPIVVKEKGKIVDVRVFPYGNEDYISFETLCQAEDYYFKEKQKDKIFSNSKDRVLGVVNATLKKANKRLNTIQNRIKDADDFERNKLYGELLIANIYRLRDGEKKAVVENYYDDYKTIEITLDDKLSVKQNAENYFKKYNKQKRSIIMLNPQKVQAEDEVKYFESLLSFINNAEDYGDVEPIVSELEEGGYIKTQNVYAKKKTETKPYRQYSIEGFIVKVGRNNIENDKLTFSSKPENLWVHAKDYHSSHIIIETESKVVPESVIINAAEICAYYSKGREGGKVEIAVTEKKNVKKPPKSKLGFCTYSNFNSYTVNPNKHEEFLIK